MRPLLARSWFLLFLSVSLRLTAHIHGHWYTTFGRPRRSSLTLCCNISMPSIGPGYTGGIRMHGRHFNDTYDRVCNIFIPIPFPRPNSTKCRADTRFLPEVERHHA